MILHGRSRVLEVCLVLLIAHGVISAEKEQEEHPAEEDFDPKDPEYNKFYESVAAASAAVKNQEDPYGFHFDYEEGNKGPSESYGLSDHLKAKATSGSVAYAPAPKQKIDPYEEVRQSVAAALYHKPAASENVPLKKAYPEKQQEQADESVIRPGPHYISHQVPLPDYFKDDEEESAQSKESETVAVPVKSKNKKKTKASKPYYGPTSVEEAVAAEPTKLEPLTYYGTKNVDYNTGKSSSTVSQYPSASGYLESFQAPAGTENPYQQYSFPPVVNYDALQSKYLESIISTPAPQKNIETAALNAKNDGTAASSDTAPESSKNKNCRKIEGPENAENMNCFVCEDAVNKAKYTQCSYAANAEPVNQYAGSSVRYSSVKAPANFRPKRSPTKGRYSEDPYFLVAERSRKYFDDLDKEQEAEESARQKDFHYTPFDDGEYESYSESQSAELLKQPGACHKVERDGSVCTVCKDPKSGGNFEQCSYSSAPKEQKYAYVAEKKYDSEDDAPEETKVVTKEASGGDETQKASPSEQIFLAIAAPENKFTSATKSKIFKDPIPELTAAGSSIDAKSNEDDDDESEVDESDESESKKKEKQISDDYNYGLAPSYSYGYGDLKKNRKLVDDDPYDVPEHFAASINKEKKAGYDDDHYDEYHYKLFPELSEAEAEARNEEQTADNAQKPQDVEEVLAEFAKKDRSNCKKAEKNGMTCFLCVDQNKVQHEECMYIAESKPRPTHIAYHEVQRLKDPHGEHLPLIDTEESKKVEVTQAADALPSETSKRKKFFKKVITTPLPLVNAELAAAASDVVYKTVVPYEREKKRYVKETIKDSRGAGSAPDSERLEDESTKQNKETEEPESPKEIEVGDEEGAYSHETEPVYSKLYGTVLPKYMVEKTDYEKDFDAASGFA